MLDQPDFIAHHIGCLTQNIESSIAVYKKMGFLNLTEKTLIKAQKVSVCFVEIRKDFYIEFVEFPLENSGLNKIFKTRNPYYHIGYMVENISLSIAHLQTGGFHLVNQFQSEAFPGKTCAFLYSPEMHLIELIGP